MLGSRTDRQTDRQTDKHTVIDAADQFYITNPHTFTWPGATNQTNRV